MDLDVMNTENFQNLKMFYISYFYLVQNIKKLVEKRRSKDMLVFLPT
jgi:hypothetical protein